MYLDVTSIRDGCLKIPVLLGKTSSGLSHLGEKKRCKSSHKQQQNESCVKMLKKFSDKIGTRGMMISDAERANLLLLDIFEQEMWK